MRRLFEAVSGKWSPLVVMTLKDGGKKHSPYESVRSSGSELRLPAIAERANIFDPVGG